MKNIFRKAAIVVIAALILCGVCLPRASAATWSGSGTEASPYLITNESTLRLLATNVQSGNTYSGKYFKVSANITLTQDWTPIGTETTAFRGTFDGNGKTISSMTVTGGYSGLFAYVGSGATIKNVTLTDFTVTGPSYVAGLVAYADADTGSITISNCSVDGTLQDNLDSYPDGYLAGIVAYANAESGSITITGCTASGSYSCDYYSGGIIGYGKGANRSLKLLNCTNRAYIGCGSDANLCGGISGYIDSAELKACMNYGSVAGNGYSEDNGSSWLGGITGSGSDNAFIGCANYGNVTTFFAGGINSAQYGPSLVDSCLNIGMLYHSSDGYGYALVRSGTVINSYYLSGTGTGITGATAAGSAAMASGAVAHALGEYFGQEIGVDAYPVPLTADNRVYKVTVAGEVNDTFYVNYGDTVTLPEISSCAAYFDGDNKFDASTPITRDYALVAKSYHNYSDGVCIYCGNEGIDYVDVGSCGSSVAWYLNNSGILRITGSGTMTDYTAATPAPWQQYASSIVSIVIDSGVTTVGDYAFAGLTNVTSVSMTDSVTAIGDYAFNGLTQLTEVTVGNNVSTVGDYAFASCTGLETLTLGRQLKTIGAYAFSQCEVLNYVSVPATVTALGNGAFRGCSGLTQLTLYSGLTTIGDYALAEIGATALEIPATVTKIGAYAFTGNDALESVTFLGSAPEIASTAFSGITAYCLTPEYDSSWDSTLHQNYGGTLTWAIGHGYCGSDLDWVVDYDGVLTISGTGAMNSFSASYPATWHSLQKHIQSVVICEGVTSIGDYAFYGLANMRSVSIPNTVTKIGSSATSTSYSCVFSDCTSLTQIDIPASVTVISPSAFFQCTNLTAINVASGNTAYSSEDGVLYDRYKDELRCYPAGKTGSFTIPSTVDEIVAYAFAYNNHLTEISIPASVTYIGTYGFGYCEALKHITFEGSALTCGTYAFLRVTADVDFPLSDTTWTPDAMRKLGGTLTWNAGSGSCGTNAQWKLTFLNGTGTLTVSGSGAMSDYTSTTLPWANYLTSINTFEVQSGVTSVGAYVLNDATALTTVTLADSVTSIGEFAFCDCSALWSLTLGNGLKTIGSTAFSATKLSSVTFPDSLQTIDRYAFSYCPYLKSLTFGDNLQTIGYTAFGGCTALQTVDLGNSVTTLDQSAFNGCSKLVKIVIPASVTSVGTYAFRNCTSLVYVEFLGNGPTINTNAFGGTTCNAYYPASASGWTASKLANYGGTVTWGIISQRGNCSSTAEWILDTTGRLYVCGSGSMTNYSATNQAPWYAHKASIKKATVRGVTAVSPYAFYGCDALREATLASTVTTVSSYSFAECPALQVVVFEASSCSFVSNAFYNTTCEMWYPSTASGYSSSVRQNYGGKLTWRSAVAKGTCGTDALWVLDSAGNLVILGAGAMGNYTSTTQPWYSNNASVTSITVGGQVTSIGNYAFRGCSAATKATVGKAVTTINSYAFPSGTTLSSVTFLGCAPSTISSYAFSGTTATVYYPLAETSWTSSKRANYGGTLTWESVCMEHQENILPAVEPTCTTTGLTQGKTCTLCGETLIAQEVIPAKGHYAMGPDNTEVPADTLEPTCTEDIVCTVCGEVAKAAPGHRVLGTTLVETDPLTITNDSTYPFRLTNGTYYSTNTANKSSSYLTITAKYDCTLTLNYGVSSEEDYDKLYIAVNGSTKINVSGEVSDKNLTLTLSAGDTVTVRYKKDESDKAGSDRGWVKLIYDNVMVEGIGDVPADTVEPDCVNDVVCRYCQLLIKEAPGHRVIVQLPEPEPPYTIVNASAVPFVLTDGVYYSSNHGGSSVAELLVNISADCTLTLNYGVSSEANCDKMTILVNGTEKTTVSGVVTDQAMTLDLAAGDVITVRYSKDSSINKEEDRCWVSVVHNYEPTQEIVPADTLEPDCEHGVVCDYCQTVVKDALGHSYGDWYVATEATCTAEGESRRDCQVCEHIDTEPIEALGHSYGDWYVATEATCTAEGESRRDCQVCDHFETETIEPMGHSYGDWYVVSESTCTQQGESRRDCQNCDHYETSYSALLPHSCGDWYVVTEATCTAQGESRRDCQNCDYFETAPIEALGHSHEATITQPTCTQQGYTTYTCACGDTYTADYTDALGHTWDKGVISKAPAEEADGEITYTCTRCGETRVEAFAGNIVTLQGKSLSLNGDIGVNFYVSLSRDLLEDENTRMLFIIGKETQEMSLADAKVAVQEDGSVWYRFSCNMPAKGMTDEIIGQLLDSQGAVGDIIPYSVAQYYEDICVKFDRDEKPELFAMIEAMLNYGASAQLYFDYHTTKLANDCVSTGLPEAVDASAYAHVLSDTEDQLSFAGASLLLESNTTLRIFFRLTSDADISSYTFTVDGRVVTPVLRDSLYYVELKDISAKELDVAHTITAGNITLTYSALSYVHNVLSKADTLNPLLVDVAKALYVYNQAANAYFASKA